MRAYRRVLPLFLFLLALPAAAGDYGELHPDAPPETEQFAFIIGKWHCQIRSMQPDRTMGEPSYATWTGRYVLDGWAIRDDWVSAQGQGFNVRSFNTETGKWDNRWLSQGGFPWKYYESEQIGDTMVMTGGEGTSPMGDFIDRNTFYDITEDSWKWRKDRSFDDGETWVQGVAHIEARREGPPLLERVKHGFVDNNGVKLHYAELGSGPLVVLLHGFPDYWYTWRDEMEALAGTHRVVALDLRGYNKSDAPPGVDAYAMRHLIGDVVATVKQLGADKATIVGHDWGGAIAWQVAQWRPDVVERLVVLSTPHPNGLFRELANNQEQQANSAYARRFQEDGAHESLTAEGLASWVTDQAAKPHYLEAFKRSNFEAMLNYYKANYPRAAGSTTRPASNSPSAPSVPSAPNKVSCPTLVIHGLDDQALMPSGFNGTWEWIEAPLTQISLPGVGHWLQQDASDTVTRTLLNWLDR